MKPFALVSRIGVLPLLLSSFLMTNCRSVNSVNSALNDIEIEQSFGKSLEQDVQKSRLSLNEVGTRIKAVNVTQESKEVIDQAAQALDGIETVLTDLSDPLLRIRNMLQTRPEARPGTHYESVSELVLQTIVLKNIDRLVGQPGNTEGLLMDLEAAIDAHKLAVLKFKRGYSVQLQATRAPMMNLYNEADAAAGAALAQIESWQYNKYKPEIITRDLTMFCSGGESNKNGEANKSANNHCNVELRDRMMAFNTQFGQPEVVVSNYISGIFEQKNFGKKQVQYHARPRATLTVKGARKLVDELGVDLSSGGESHGHESAEGEAYLRWQNKCTQALAQAVQMPRQQNGRFLVAAVCLEPSLSITATDHHGNAKKVSLQSNLMMIWAELPN